jgi:hypothetical protein
MVQSRMFTICSNQTYPLDRVKSASVGPEIPEGQFKSFAKKIATVSEPLATM